MIQNLKPTSYKVLFLWVCFISPRCCLLTRIFYTSIKVKVAATRMDPQFRVKELSSQFGNPIHFRVGREWRINDSNHTSS